MERRGRVAVIYQQRSSSNKSGQCISSLHLQISWNSETIQYDTMAALNKVSSSQSALMCAVISQPGPSMWCWRGQTKVSPAAIDPPPLPLPPPIREMTAGNNPRPYWHGFSSQQPALTFISIFLTGLDFKYSNIGEECSRGMTWSSSDWTIPAF